MKKFENEYLPALRKRVSKASLKPGVYKWLNAKGEVLYVGKAKNLRNRLKSYVSPAKDASLGPWKESLIKKFTDFDTIVTSTELEALVLESNLIKALKPKYNVLLKDDKNYVYARITKDPFPYIEVVRRMDEDHAKYFGPFLTASGLRRLLDVLQEIYGFRACSKSLDQLNKDSTMTLMQSCLEYQIGKCCGLCVGAISHKEYINRVEHVTSFFKGSRKDVLHQVQKKMQDAAQQKKFEKAARLRDAYQYIQSLQEQQVVSDTTGANADYIGVVLQSEKAQVVLLQERGGKLVGERNFSLGGQAETVKAVLEQFLPQYYSTATDIPSSVVLGKEIRQQDVMEEWLSERNRSKVDITIPERGKKSKLLVMAEQNAQEKILQQLAKWEAAAKNTAQALSDLQKILSLPVLPKRIEGYDISHFGGEETVGSMVVMRNGKSANDYYRSFTIRTLHKGKVDDYAALKEVLRRRLLYIVRNIREEEKNWKLQGVTFGKPRKAEQELVQTLCNVKDIAPYCAIARCKNEIVAVGVLLKHKTLLELDIQYLSASNTDAHIESFLVRKMLKAHKKGKIYCFISSEKESQYAEIGFRHIHTVPNTFKSKKGIPMVYIVADHKDDISLKSRPDLLVIDGGKGQLSTVVNVLKELNVDIPVIGLAKREEDVFVAGQKTFVPFPKNSQAKFLLMRLRDEAHRFANRHREARGKKAMTHSVLDDISGIGSSTKKLLLQEFGSVEKMKEASDDQLRSVLSQQQLSALRSGL